MFTLDGEVSHAEEFFFAVAWDKYRVALIALSALENFFKFSFVFVECLFSF